MNSTLNIIGKNISLMFTGIAIWLILTETGVIKTRADQISDIVQSGSEVTISTPPTIKGK